jgi:hypothetical protein
MGQKLLRSSNIMVKTYEVWQHNPCLVSARVLSLADYICPHSKESLLS